MLASVVTARLTLVSIQLGCTAALVVLTVGLYLRRRAAGLSAMWLVWLVAPGLRRLFFLSEPVEAADPLALAPFLVTAAVVALEFTQVELSPRSRRLLTFVAAGYAIGMPLGMLTSPPSAVFALFAYGTAAGVFIIGYRDGARRDEPVLPRLLMVAAPFLALYAFRQYYAELPVWDEVWRTTAEITTVGSPDEGRIRVWSTLNSPGTFAWVLGISAIAFISASRLSPVRLVGALTVFGALALTYVRSAWIGLVAALLALVLVTRGGVLKRVAPVIVVMAALAPVALSGSAQTALNERVGSFGELGDDTSAQARVDTPFRLVPRAILQPLGRGVGQAGEATRLSDSGGGFRHTDNGYLSVLLQVGPVGFLLVIAAVAMVFKSAWRNVRRRRPDATDVFVAGALAFFVVTMIAGDWLYGVGGMVFWYIAGLAVGRHEDQASAAA